MITVSCFHQLSAATAWRDSINALNLASDRPDPFSSFEFYEHCLRFPADQSPAPELWLLLALKDGALLGCLALKRCIDRVLGRPVARLVLLTAQRSDRPRLVVRDGDAAAVADAIYRYLLGRHREWSLLEFQQQDEGSTLTHAVAVGRGYQCRQWPNEANASIAIRWTSGSGYLADLPKKHRAAVRRSLRLLSARGRVECLSSDDARLTPLLFELYREVERQSWKAATATGFDDNGGWCDYYRGLLASDRPMPIRVDVLLLDGRPIAGLISGLFANSGYALHIVHDERDADLAPGSAVMFLGVQRAIVEGRDAFHLLWGYGYYKRRWLAALSETRSLQVYRTGSLLLLRRRLGDLRRRLRGETAAAETTLSNPARPSRDRPAAGAGAAPVPLASPRQAALAASFIAGGGECLSSAQFAAMMPLPNRSRDVAKASLSR